MGRRYPSRPVVGVGAVVLDEDRVLLVRRGQEPQKGLWSIPGGGLELGETLEEGARREAREETGLDVRILRFLGTFERILRDDAGEVEFHYVLADYLCEPAGGDLRAGDDADRAEWFRRDEIDDLPTTPSAGEGSWRSTRSSGRGRIPRRASPRRSLGT